MSETTFHIYKGIGPLAGVDEWDTVTDDAVRSWLNYMEYNGEKKGTIRINSGGGNIVAAQGIYAMLKNSTVKINTYIDGLAASAASFIAMAGRKVYMADYAKLMIHNCSGGAQGNIKDMEKEIETQKAINDTMCKVYAAKTGMSEDEIKTMMEAETWMSAEEALKMGFVDEVVSTGKKDKAPTAQLAANELCAYYASIIETNNKPDMKIIATALTALGVQVAPAATEQQMADAITAQMQQYKAAAEKAETDKTALEQQLSEFKTAQITALVDGAVASGRITAEQKETWTALANTNLASATAALNALQPRTKLTGSTTTASAATGTESRTTWDFEKWSKEDPAGLKQLKATQPEQYQALLKTYTA